jgi:hypothetical protein
MILSPQLLLYQNKYGALLFTEIGAVVITDYNYLEKLKNAIKIGLLAFLSL